MMTDEQIAEFRKWAEEDTAAKLKARKESQGRIIRGLILPVIVFLYQVLVNGSVARGLFLAVMVYLFTWGGYIFE